MSHCIVQKFKGLSCVTHRNPSMSVSSSAKTLELTNDTLSSSCRKKVLYFSDGTLEVDDLDGDNSDVLDTKSAAVNPQELAWIPWVWHHTLSAGSRALEVCDYLGESLASFFGITTPKYQFELNEYYRMKREEDEEMRNYIEMGDQVKQFNLSKAEDGAVGAVTTGPTTFSEIRGSA